MTLDGRCERLTVLVAETDQHGHQPVYTEIVARARAMHLAGATVLHGIEGSVEVVIVERADRIEAFLPQLRGLVDEGLVLRQPVEVVLHRSRE